MLQNIKHLSSLIPKALKYVSAAKVVLHYLALAKKDVETIFDDIEGNEPEYLQREKERF